MQNFDVSLIHRLADQLEGIAKDIKEHVNSPDELENDLVRINSIAGSLQSQAQAKKMGSNPSIVNNNVR
ncbi:hypothetical protein [Ammoniphilus sp. CFH 90114]|uniref:hypothetical protein n=1 Tax=Ammoniphilus sp. CFH 90114 TaxID=2493665 RepID=UPI00100F71E7|nr:hypothetical protein [Ammoniphilus sp. CFH 90114]RXT15351.1 hypothetical protein EIZ39_03865 [Ammoniphilus sp. CFH 90114]